MITPTTKLLDLSGNVARINSNAGRHYLPIFCEAYESNSGQFVPAQSITIYLNKETGQALGNALLEACQ